MPRLCYNVARLVSLSACGSCDFLTLIFFSHFNVDILLMAPLPFKKLLFNVFFFLWLLKRYKLNFNFPPMPQSAWIVLLLTQIQYI